MSAFKRVQVRSNLSWSEPIIFKPNVSQLNLFLWLFQQWATFARTWHVFDCKWQDPYDSAQVIKKYLMGLHKPIYHPTNDCGDVVVCINSRDIALRGDEWRKRAYFHHTGYPGGASWTLAWELHNKDPTMVSIKQWLFPNDSYIFHQRYIRLTKLNLKKTYNKPCVSYPVNSRLFNCE